jgi:hypothetical protein
MKRGLIKFNEPAQPLPVDVEERWDLYGVVIEDAQGREHHFGRGPWVGRPFLYVATYDPDGTREVIYWADDVEEPIRTGHQVRDAKYGPRLSPTVRIALARLAERCNLGKGFASPEEKGWAVETLQALHQHGREPFDPEEVFVFAATNGWPLKAAAKLRDFAIGIREGRWFNRRPGGRIHVPPDRAQRMLEMWRGESLALPR